MRTLVVGDIHLCDRPPSIRTDDYLEHILDKLAYTVEVAEQQDVMAVVWAGDVFHIKTPGRNSHYMVQRVIDIGQDYLDAGIGWYVVPGNHDLSHDRLDWSHQPLGLLFKSGAIPCIGEMQGLGVFGIPWLQDWDAQLPGYMQKWQESTAGLMVTHAPIAPPGKTYPYEFVDATDWAKAMQRPGDVYYGHMHMTHGSYSVETEEGVFWFCNQGALSRGSLHEETLAREPAVTVYEYA